MFSKEYLSVKFSHLNHLINELPYGTYGKNKGKEVINIFFLPSDPKVSWRSSRRYYIDSKQGRRYGIEVAKSASLRKECEGLLFDWKNWYKGVPIEIQMPYKRSDSMNFDFFEKSLENQNHKDNGERGLEYNGRVFRSKNEILAAQVLEKLGVEYKVEPKFSSGTKFFYPDFIIGAREIDKSAYVEIYGMMDDPEYTATSGRKNALYLQAGYRQGRDYIPFYTGSAKTFDVEAFETQIKAWLELAAEDIISQISKDSEKT